MAIDARELFLQQHATLHSRRVAACEGDFYVADSLFSLTEEELRWMAPEMNSIVWYLWHITRCEDIAANTLVARQPQVFHSGGWGDRMGVSRPDVGIGMTKAEVAEFSRVVDIQALHQYRDAVGLRTREVARTVDWNQTATPEDIERLRSEVGVDLAQEWVYQRFAGKSAAWFLHWLAAGHLFWHVGQCRLIRKLYGQRGG